ncbi:hypothetical protein [Cyclobacterium marinum]|uniref:Uncharacterized protein n=1 Tax=Cyclobacterium marinum (strain ATCC 25205 / DSM 745 / LMG 13164 / NCIMB 1802) TaxID=880070 RepID=G0IY87_CYCMS|nr:hypothetical protein [Cyclobacterium marinum]AEL24991.1 hypothetical protein Cycma_1219 [Cyclobacterium marinum DSM 745]
MKIIQPKSRPEISENAKLSKIYSQFENLITVLNGIGLPDNIKETINASIEQLNSASKDNLLKKTKKEQVKIVKLIEKQLKIVPINHYRNTWMALGMVVFGLPLGIAFGTILDNIGLLGIGLPIGMVIGLAVGTGMDKKAKEEGRQLNIEVSY